MPSVVKTYTFDTTLEGFTATEGAVSWLVSDGQDLTPASAPGCLRNAGTVGSGAFADIDASHLTGEAKAALTGLTWEVLGVPAGKTVTSVAFALMARTVTHTNSDSAQVTLRLDQGGTGILAPVPGAPNGDAAFVDLYGLGGLGTDGAWHSSADFQAAFEADGFASAFAVPESYSASDTPFDLILCFIYNTNGAAALVSTFVIDVRIDTLRLTIEYVDLSVELTETLVLIVADPAGIISDPEIPPAGGSGAPKRFDDGGFTDDCGPENAAATVCTRTSRTIPVALASHLAGTALTLAYCLRLARRDGEVLGFTTHDHDLTFGGLTYETLNSLAVTALRQELGGGVGNLDLSGLIRSDRVTAADLLAGRYDGAEITLTLVNWASLGDGAVTLARGWFGSVQLVDGQWQAEYRSIAQRLQQEIVRVTSPLCDVAQLGDDRCKVNLAPFQFSRTVASVTDTRQMVFSGDSHGSGYFSHGRCYFTSGENDGLDREIKTHTHAGSTAVIVLQLGVPFPIAPGDTATLEAGCDRRLTTCQSRFSNVVNNRSFPHVPGYGALRKIKGLRVVG